MLTGLHFAGPQRGWAVGHQSMIISTEAPLYAAEQKDPEHYTPSNLRRMGRR
jgi:hypothetical protein